MSTGNPSITFGGFTASKDLLTDLTKLRPPYDDVPRAGETYGKKLERDWKLHMVSPPSRIGYDGALFSTEIDGKPHYFLYHQGTNDIKDMPSIARLANGKVPQQMDEVNAFTKAAGELIAQKHPGEDIPIIQSGYSLGGALAILASDGKQPVIAFDPPGTKKIIESEGRDPQVLGQHVLEVLSPHANYVNAHEAHIGSVLIAGEKFWQTDKVSVGNFLAMSVQSHRIKNIGLGIASMDSLPCEPAETSPHPTEVWDALRDYVSDNISESPTLGERGLAVTTKVVDKLALDKVMTKIVVAGAEAITSRIVRDVVEQHPLQEHQGAQTNASVEHVVEPVVQQQPETLPEAPSANFTARIAAERAQPKQHGIG